MTSGVPPKDRPLGWTSGLTSSGSRTDCHPSHTLQARMTCFPSHGSRMMSPRQREPSRPLPFFWQLREQQAGSEFLAFPLHPPCLASQVTSEQLIPSPRAPRDLVPLRWILRAHGVTPAHQLLRTQAKTLGASSCLSEPPKGAASRPDRGTRCVLVKLGSFRGRQCYDSCMHACMPLHG
jgi:hypothetical protein